MEHGAKFNRSSFNRLAFGLQGNGNVYESSMSAVAKIEAECVAQSAHQISLLIGLKPGQVLEIDSERMEIRIDGELITWGYCGINMFMQPATTVVHYKDSANTRNLQATITYTDRYY